MVELTAAQQEQFTEKLTLFAINVHRTLSLLKPNETIVFSPFSIKTCAAMVRVGAEGETAKELEVGLGLISSDLATIAQSFSNVLAKYQKSNILKMANRIYIMKGFTVKKQYKDMLKQKFFSDAEEVDFKQNVAAAKTINGWVESKTNRLIKDLISANALNQDTRLVLLNAVHFKGEWKTQFDKRHTAEGDFYLNESDSVKVTMMNVKAHFRYANLRESEASVLEMPYKDSDLAMLVILPHSRTGLNGLEQHLATVRLSDITKKMRFGEIAVQFPKFKVEFSVELEKTFKQLGMTRMFSDSAEFGQMLERNEQIKVSKIIHKAFIEVNEEGTEAAAATGIMMMTRSAKPMPVAFTADHPFIYVIYHSETSAAENVKNSAAPNLIVPLFMGSIVRLDNVSSTGN